MKVFLKIGSAVLFALFLITATSCSRNTTPPSKATAAPNKSANPFQGKPEAIQEGQNMYRSYCSGCHGGSGHGGKCPDLTDDLWIHGGADEEVFLTINKGVSGTEMRNFEVGLKPEEIWKLIAYIRSIAAAGGESAWKPFEDGDAAHGKALFSDAKGQAQCYRCHMVLGEGGRIGPDLSRIGAKRTPDYILESIVKPSADIVDGYLQFTVTTKNGTETIGYKKNEDNFTMQLISTEDELVSLEKSDIASVSTNKNSVMVEGLEKLLSKKELHDIMAYLKTLNGKPASK